MTRSNVCMVLLYVAITIAIGQLLISCIYKKPAVVNVNYEAIVRKVTISAKKYEKTTIAAVLIDIVQQGNDKLQDCGELPFGLVIVGCEAETIDDFDLKEGSFYEALEQVSSKIGYRVEVGDKIRIIPGRCK